jgi:uncharacterized iron-regulated protein
MDYLKETVRQMRITTLITKLELRESEDASLSREITSPFTSPCRRVEAIERRAEAQAEWLQIVAELEALSQSL